MWLFITYSYLEADRIWKLIEENRWEVLSVRIFNIFEAVCAITTCNNEKRAKSLISKLLDKDISL